MKFPAVQAELDEADRIVELREREETEARARFEREDSYSAFMDLDMAIRLAAGARSRRSCLRSDIDVLAI